MGGMPIPAGGTPGAGGTPEVGGGACFMASENFTTLVYSLGPAGIAGALGAETASAPLKKRVAGEAEALAAGADMAGNDGGAVGVGGMDGVDAGAPTMPGVLGGFAGASCDSNIRVKAPAAGFASRCAFASSAPNMAVKAPALAGGGIGAIGVAAGIGGRSRCALASSAPNIAVNAPAFGGAETGAAGIGAGRGGAAGSRCAFASAAPNMAVKAPACGFGGALIGAAGVAGGVEGEAAGAPANKAVKDGPLLAAGFGGATGAAGKGAASGTALRFESGAIGDDNSGCPLAASTARRMSVKLGSPAGLGGAILAGLAAGADSPLRDCSDMNSFVNDPGSGGAAG